MKKLFIIILLLLQACVHVFAAIVTHYVSATATGSGNGLSTGSPWTLAQLNANWSSINAGDIVLLKRGDVIYGSITVTKSGTSGNPITIGAYGSGSNPIITGFTNVTSFTQISTNIWESNALATNISGCNMVAINGTNVPMGKTPNSTYYKISSAIGVTSLTSSSLNTSVIDWTGAEAVIRFNRYTLGRGTINSASGSTINYTTTVPSYFPAQNNYGFFIQNDKRTLDVQNEWYYNPNTKKVDIYSTSSPSGVQLATIDNLISISGQSYITIQDISFTGANTYGISVTGSNHITVSNCSFDYIGQDAFHGYPNNPYTVVQNCTINHSNNYAINAGASANTTITGNTILNTGMLAGMGSQSSDYKGIHVVGTDATITNNSVDNTGYNAIEFDGDRSVCNNNFVNHACMVLDDGGGIYTSPELGQSSNVQRSISNNIVVNLGTTPYIGTDDIDLQTVGIYCDQLSANVDIVGNTVQGANWGMLLNNNHDMNINGNTVYDCRTGVLFRKYQVGVDMTNFNVQDNIFFGKTASQVTQEWTFVGSNPIALPNTYLSNNNYFARPIDDNLTIRLQTTDQNINMWRTYSGQDANSKISPITISNTNKLLFTYSIQNDSTIVLPAGTWIDVTNTTYNTGSIFLPAYTSKVLINTGTNVAPIADAGTNKNITLPTSTITQVGRGTDADDTIASYSWVQVSGAATATIASPNSATTVINGLSVAGNYVFQLTVRDNFGLAATDTMSVVVNASAPVNLPPVVNAGGNKNITLPTSSLTQSGSATDPDGTIASYAWTQGSNPTAATIASPTSAVTVISGMTVAGTYSFTLTATDNSGATGSQTITVIVNTAAPIAPIANAGSDQSITWPSNSVSLAGSGTDADGVIVAYNWSKLSGANAIISNPNSQNTNVTFPQVGTYIFQLKVTDNSGLTGTDNVQVVVNKGTVTISFSNPTLTQTWTGLPLAPTVITSPANVPYSILYNGIGATPIEPNSYSVTAATTDGNYVVATVSGTFTINKAIATFNITGTSVYFNNNSQAPFVTTNPANLTGVSIVSPHTNPGIYSVTISLNNPHYQATDVVTPFTITTAGASMTITGYQNKFYTGGQISVVPVTNPAGLTYSLTYNGSTTPPTNAGTYQVIATITQTGYSGSDTVSMTINKVPTTNTLTWQPIANVQEGTVLTTQQLNASSSLPGTFVYDLPLGYLLSAGVYRITGTFYPTDSANYSSSTIQNTLIVYGSPILQILILHGKAYPLDYPQ